MELQPESMEDVEDGEITSSESDTAMKTFGIGHQEAPEQKSAELVCALKAFEVRDASPAVVSSNVYRSTAQVVSSEESDSDSDNDDRALWKRKRQKCTNHPIPKPPVVPAIQSSQKLLFGGRKVNNIWGSVLQEQNQDTVATELGILGMEGNTDTNSRQSEAYNFAMARKLIEQQNKMKKIEEAAKLDRDLDNYMQKKRGNLKRKRAMKEKRYSVKLEEMDFKGRYELSEEDSEERVADEIAHRLREQKKELIARVVKYLGKKKAIELLMETTEIEQNGGLYVVDGSRRRTPGGVYLNLLKSSPGITSQHIKDIFFHELQKEGEDKKAARKRRHYLLAKKMKKVIKGLNLHEHDDASRETFASDTNEALASLEDSHEDPVEMKADTEDAIEIDHTHDVEIF